MTPGVKDPDYGKFRLLELPRDATVSGPGQVQNQFRSDTEAQKVLNILRQGETDVINGNLLTLPVGGGLLYVQPVYVKSSQGTQFPLLQKVFVSFGDQVGFADTLSGALDQVFGDRGRAEPDTGTPTPTPTPTPSPTPTPTNPDGSESRAALAHSSARCSAGDSGWPGRPRRRRLRGVRRGPGRAEEGARAGQSMPRRTLDGSDGC